MAALQASGAAAIVPDETLVLPGDDLGPIDGAECGAGVYASGECVRASLAGRVTRGPGGLVAVARDARGPRGGGGGAPEVGAFVLARVTRITTLTAHADVLLVGDAPPAGGGAWSGVVKKEYVAGAGVEVDKLRIDECFRPGDVIRAEVVSLGDKRSLYLSTARDECGVVAAVADISRLPLRPVDARWMVEPASGARELRKVAVLPTHLLGTKGAAAAAVSAAMQG